MFFHKDETRKIRRKGWKQDGKERKEKKKRKQKAKGEKQNESHKEKKCQATHPPSSAPASLSSLKHQNTALGLTTIKPDPSNPPIARANTNTSSSSLTPK